MCGSIGSLLVALAIVYWKRLKPFIVFGLLIELICNMVGDPISAFSQISNL